MNLCNVDKQTGFCDYCGCQTTKNKETKEYYCIALEAELAAQGQWDEEEIPVTDGGPIY